MTRGLFRKSPETSYENYIGCKNMALKDTHQRKMSQISNMAIFEHLEKVI